MAPIFDFKAFSGDGKARKGLVEAENSKAARQKLKKQGLMVTEITEKSAAKPSASGGLPFLGGRVSVKETALMTRQLASLVKANIPLVEALNALVEQTEKTLQGAGRVLLRYSGTEPKIRLLIEGRDAAAIEKAADTIAGRIAAHIGA